jgi:hypothetical protein
MTQRITEQAQRATELRATLRKSLRALRDSLTAMGTGKVGRAEVQINLSTYNPINYCYTEGH